MAAQTQVSSDDRLLRSVLRANVVFSAISGACFVLASAPIAGFLGIETATVFGVLSGSAFILVMGLIVLAFAAGLYFSITRESIGVNLAWGVIALDTGWVVASIIVLAAGLLPFSTEGSWAVLVISDIVGIFAIMEYIGLRRMRSSLLNR